MLFALIGTMMWAVPAAAQDLIDPGTQCFGMHTCPADSFSVMTGIHVGRNLQLCAVP